jgi:hypothetical protein
MEEPGHACSSGEFAMVSSLRIKDHSKIDPLSGSTQANESFHAVKGKYTDKRLNFTTSTEARFALGVICQSRNPG